MGYAKYTKQQLIEKVQALEDRVVELEGVNEVWRGKERHYGHLMETMSDGVVIEDTMNRIVYVNQSFCETLGYSEEALVGRPTTDIIHPDGIELYLEQTGRRPFEPKASYEQKIRARDGRSVPVIISVRALYNEQGDYEGCLTVITDITVLKEAEKKLRESEEEFRNLFENSQAGVFRTSVDGTKYLAANDKMAEIFGLSRKDLLTRSPLDLWADPTDRMEMMRQLNEKGELTDHEIRIKHISGDIRTCAITLRIFPEQNYLEGVAVDVTERKRAEEALQESEEKYRTVVENSHASIYILDKQGKFLFMNSTLAEKLGGSASDFIGQALSDLFPAELARHRMNYVQEVFRTRQGRYAEYQAEINDEPHWFRTRLQVLRDHQGQMYAVLGITIEITEQKLAEIRLRESEERYRTLVEGAGFPIFALDREGKFIYLNWIAAAGLGGYPKNFVGKTMGEVFPEPVADYQMRIARQVFASGEGMEVESITAARGENRWFHTSINPVKDANGRINSVIGIAVDITEQKQAQEVLQRGHDKLEQMVEKRTAELRQANQQLQKEIKEREQVEEALRKSEKRFRDFLDNLGDAAYETDAWGNLTYANKMAATITGIPLPELLNKPFLPLFTNESRKTAIDVYQRTLQGETPEYELTFTNGKIGHFKNKPLMNQDGQIIGVYGIARDVTERKHQEEELNRYREHLEELVRERTVELQKSEEKYRQVIENSHDIFYAISPDGIVTFISPQAIRMGFTEEEVVGHNIQEFIHPDDIESTMSDLAQTVATGKTPVTEFRLLRKDGSFIYAEETGEAIYEDGQVKQIVGSIRDVTERRQAEAQLQRYREKMVRTERLASLGTIGATLVHQLNQPFTVLRLMLEDCLAELAQANMTERVRENLKDALAALTNAESIIHRYRDFARPSATAVEEEINLPKIALQVAQVFSESARHAHLKIELENLDQAPGIVGDPSDVEQIIFGLIENAIQAAQGPGEYQMTIRARYQPKKLELEFADNCGGIDPRDQGKIFETFFTTKPQGTGLGLSIIKQIISDCSGQIRVESQVGQGTTFFVTLPWIP